MIYEIKPVPKPRMTRRDKWKNPPSGYRGEWPRPCVARYWAFCDEVRALKLSIPEHGAKIEFYLPMPQSWSKKKRHIMAYTPHQQKPDISNLLKALEDAVYDDDSVIWHYAGLAKHWSHSGHIKIEVNP